MALLSFVAAQYIPYSNFITVNGSDPVRVQNGYYKVKDDSYTVVVHGANGQAWECEGRVRSFGSCTECLSIRVAQDQSGNITGVQYAVLDLSGTQEWAASTVAQKLNLTFSNSAPTSSTYDPPVSSTSEAPTSRAYEPSTSTAEAPAAPAKKGGTGWIIFGVICVAAAFLTAEGMGSIIGCGVTGAISLLIGLKKKTCK
ncbi:MAG: hypothetical protein IJO05_02565 [Oscillospiraceae bacterium]|nr:hypothetical protein [Oscillospiraceae bacterium]